MSDLPMSDLFMSDLPKPNLPKPDLMLPRLMRALVSAVLLAAAAACAPAPPPLPPAPPAPVIVPGYGPMIDNGYALPAIPARYLVVPNRHMLVVYTGDVGPDTIEIDPYAKFLYYVNDDGTAMRYPIAVGRAGKSLRGTTTIRRKVEWPGWQPTANMLRTEPEVYGAFRAGIPGGLRSPLGARGLYLYRGGRDTHYRIHGTNDMQSIGNSGSAGCIRLFNQDVIDLYSRVKIGTKVVIRSEADSLRLEGADYSPRGVELPPTIIPAEELLGPAAVAADHKVTEDGTTPEAAGGSAQGSNG